MPIVWNAFGDEVLGDLGVDDVEDTIVIEHDLKTAYHFIMMSGEEFEVNMCCHFHSIYEMKRAIEEQEDVT
eukprot:1584693-Amphidinium_carterae.1